MKVSDKSLKSRFALFRFLPLMAIGALIFAFNANQEMPYMIKGYVTLLEVQTGLLAVFLGSRKWLRLGKKSVNL